MAQELNTRSSSTIRGRLLAGTAAAALLAASATMAQAQSLPTGGVVVGGSATITHTSPTQLQITSTTNRSAVNWQSFSIAQGYGVNVTQPNSTSTQLENVTGSSPSQIFGSLSSNGRIVLANPNGIWFGPTAQVDVAGIVATTSSPSRSDINTFVNGGNLAMSQAGNANAAVVNQGTITVAQAGLAAFVAPGVSNQGVIQARLGTVQLSSGTTPTLDFYGDGLINIAVNGQTLAQAIDPSTGKSLGAAASNSGTISANGGTVYITANVAAGAVDQTINVSGVVQAQSVSQQNGQIVLNGGSTGTVEVAGTLDASGTGSGETGGTVKVLGNNVQLASNSAINVSGDAGGGTVDVGGDAHGAGPDPNANTTTVAKGAIILANAVTSGNGGNVAVWSNQSTSFDGTVSAQGGSQSGNGGQVETSGGQLSVGNDAIIDASAPAGAAGTWLLDPSGNLYGNSTNTVPTGAPAGSSSFSTTAVQTTLNGGTNVTETANQDLYVTSAIAWTTNAHLGLTATHSLYIEAPITATGASAELDLSVNSGTDPWSTLAGNLTEGRLYVLPSSFGNVSGGVTLAATDTLKINGTTYTLITNNTDFAAINLASGHYALVANLTAPSVSADWSGTFNGVLEGLGHAIMNESITVATGGATTDVGLFGVLGASGVINDLGFVSPNVTTTGTATVNMGALVGTNNGVVANSWAMNSTITSNPTTVPNQTFEGAGGLIGLNQGLLITSFANGTTITSAGKGAGSGSGHAYGLGGVAGVNMATGAIVGSYSQNATLNSTNNSGVGTYLGGFVGYNAGSILADLYFGAPFTTSGHNIATGTFAAGGTCISTDLACTNNPVTVTESGSFTKVYDGTTSASGAVSGSGLLGGDTFVDLSAAFPNPNVGSYTLSINGLVINYGGVKAPNYYYTVNLTAANGTITPAPLTITASDVSTQYGTTPVALSGFTDSGLVNGETISAVTETSTANVAAQNAGTYTGNVVITPGSEVGGNGFLASNYSITLNPGTLTITPSESPVTITADNQSTSYGNTPIPLPGTAFSVTGLVAVNQIGMVTETSSANVAAQNAGVYAGNIVITPGSATSGGGTGFLASNYTTVTYNPGTLTIFKSESPVTITADNQSQNFGSPFNFTGTEFTVTGLVAGNTLTTVTLTSPGDTTTAPAGNYAITPSAPTTGTFNPSNYFTVNYVDGTLTVIAPPPPPPQTLLCTADFPDCTVPHLPNPNVPLSQPGLSLLPGGNTPSAGGVNPAAGGEDCVNEPNELLRRECEVRQQNRVSANYGNDYLAGQTPRP